jgi:hypothetical protein
MGIFAHDACMLARTAEFRGSGNSLGNPKFLSRYPRIFAGAIAESACRRWLRQSAAHGLEARVTKMLGIPGTESYAQPDQRYSIFQSRRSMVAMLK